MEVWTQRLPCKVNVMPLTFHATRSVHTSMNLRKITEKYDIRQILFQVGKYKRYNISYV